MADGTSMDFAAGDAYEIPPGHDAWVVGDETMHSYEFSGSRTFALAPGSVGGGRGGDAPVHRHRGLDGDARAGR
jgi:hypothetical protein